MNVRPICEVPVPQKISTGQAGPEVNRDLETIFATLKDMIRCQKRIKLVLDAISQGAFTSGGTFTIGGGSGSGGTGGTIIIPQGSGSRPFVVYSDSNDFTLPTGFVGIVYIDATADIEVTLSDTPGAADEITIINTSSTANSITLKDGVATIATLPAGAKADIVALSTAAGDWQWPTGVQVASSGGSLTLVGSLYLSDSGNGILFATAGNVFEMTLSGAGVVATADQGSATVEPS